MPGTFVYSPAAGTVLAVGTHTLSVTFTPTDLTRYTTATATQTLVVNAPPVAPGPDLGGAGRDHAGDGRWARRS